MKILGITLLMFILLASVSLGIDLSQDFEVHVSIKRAFNPLYVMELPELVILFLLILILFSSPVFTFF
ncbi:hypothetical protein JOD18_000165 [Gracilibacillus alcaliphilus]|nr:hypothetical protein [Gracilibacillus alcaliphilus]